MARLLRLALTAPWPLALVGAATVAAAAATIAMMVVIAHIVAAAFAGPGAVAAPWLWGVLALVAARSAAVGVGEAAAQRIATAIKSQLRLRTVANLIAQGRNLGTDRTGELVTTTLDGVEKLDVFYRRFLPQAIGTAVVPLLVAGAVAIVDPWSAVLLGITGPLIPLFMWLLGTAAQDKAREQWTALSRLGGRFLDTLQGLSTLAAFGRAPDAALSLADASEELRVRTMRVLRIAFLSGFVLELAASVSTALVAASIGVRLIEGWMPFESGLAVLLLTPEFYLPFRQLAQRHHAGMEGVAAADEIFRRLDEGAEAAVSEGKRVATPTIAARRLSYRYPGSEADVIDQVTVTFSPRSLTAVIGESGAGKSTLIALLLRLIEPTGGAWQMNGQEARAMSAADWRQHFAFVPQRPRFLHGSILENLRMGHPDATELEVRAAARLAHADAFIEALPGGYDTVIDDTASALSGGERQRLALTRALLKPAPILVLDEPTSSLDAATEALIAETLQRVRRERSIIVVTHRMEIIRTADHVICLENGRLVGDTDTREVA